MMQIAIVNMHLKMGGIKKSLENLLDGLNDTPIQIDLYLLRGDKEEVLRIQRNRCVRNVFVIGKTNIYYHTLGEQKNVLGRLLKLVYGMSSRLFGRYWTLSHLVKAEQLADKKYDVVISYSNGIWTYGKRGFTGGCELLAKRISGGAKVAWIHSNPKNLGITKKVGEEIYSSFDKIVNVSFGCKEIFDGICPELIGKSVVVYNLTGSSEILKLKEEFIPYDGGFNILTVARLDNKSKRLDCITECCRRLKNVGCYLNGILLAMGMICPY